MPALTRNTFGARDTLTVGGKSFYYYRLSKLEELGKRFTIGVGEHGSSTRFRGAFIAAVSQIARGLGSAALPRRSTVQR